MIFNSQAEVASFFRRNPRTVREWCNRGCPGETGKYDLFAILEWCEENIWVTRRTKSPSEDDEGNPDYERAKARRMQTNANWDEVKFQVYQGTLIERETLSAGFNKLATTLRNIGELLQQQFGEEALRIFNEGLDDTEAQIDDMLSGDSEISEN